MALYARACSLAWAFSYSGSYSRHQARESSSGQSQLNLEAIPRVAVCAMQSPALRPRIGSTPRQDLWSVITRRAAAASTSEREQRPRRWIRAIEYRLPCLFCLEMRRTSPFNCRIPANTVFAPPFLSTGTDSPMCRRHVTSARNGDTRLRAFLVNLVEPKDSFDSRREQTFWFSRSCSYLAWYLFGKLVQFYRVNFLCVFRLFEISNFPY